MNTLSASLPHFLIDTTARVTVLLALTAIIALLSRRASASFRHLIWSLGLGCALSRIISDTDPAFSTAGFCAEFSVVGRISARFRASTRVERGTPIERAAAVTVIPLESRA
jgi:hypothetical protein